MLAVNLESLNEPVCWYKERQVDRQTNHIITGIPDTDRLAALALPRVVNRVRPCEGKLGKATPRYTSLMGDAWHHLLVASKQCESKYE